MHASTRARGCYVLYLKSDIISDVRSHERGKTLVIIHARTVSVKEILCRVMRVLHAFYTSN